MAEEAGDIGMDMDEEYIHIKHMKRSEGKAASKKLTDASNVERSKKASQADASKKLKQGKTAATPGAVAAGAGAAPGQPMKEFYGHGLNPQIFVPGHPPGGITFMPGYQGIRLGQWTLPRTVPPQHLEDNLCDPEDTLSIGAAYGLRLGIPATPAQVEAASRGMAYPVLPSGSHSFPMDSGMWRCTSSSF